MSSDNNHDTLEITIEVPHPHERTRLVRAAGIEPRRTARDALRIAGLESGDLVSVASLESSLAEAEPVAALERAIRLLGHREHSSLEIAQRLDRDGYPEPVIKAVIERLSGWGYIDESRYTESLIVTKKMSGWGRSRIGRALRDSGISDDAISDALDAHLPEDGELDRASAHLRPARDSDSRWADRQVARLMRKGFTYEIARKAVYRSINSSDDS